MSTQLEFNPFVHKLEMPLVRKVQVCVMSLTVAPLRFITGFILFLITWLLGILFTVGSAEELTEPLGVFRTILYDVLQAFGRLTWKLLGFSFVVKGKRVPPEEAPIAILAPHTSPFDIILWFVCPPLPAAFSKRENFKLPMFGTLVKAVQPVLVTRDDDVSRQSALNQIKSRVQRANRWPQLNVFPEGTSTNGRCLIMFKVGAFLSGTSVQPVTVRYTNSWNTYINTESSAGYFKVLWLTLCQFWSVVEIEYLPVYSPSIDEKSDAKLFANNVRTLMAKKLDLPCTNHTFRDRQLMKIAAKFGFPKECVSTELHKISSKYGIDFDMVRVWLADFASMSKRVGGRQRGLVSLKEFAEFLGLPVTLAVRDLFEVHDSTAQGQITVNQYVTGMALLCSTATAENTLEFSSDVYKQYLSTNGAAPSLINVGETKELYFDMAVVAREIEKRRRTQDNEIPVKEFLSRRPEYAMLCLWYQLMLKKGSDAASHTSNVNNSASLSSELRKRTVAPH